MRILVIEPALHGPSARRIIEEIGDVDYVRYENHETLLRLAAQGSYEAVFTTLGVPMDASVLDAFRSLRWIVTPTTGLDHIDTSEAAKRSIRVISLRGELDFLETVHATAEHTWALLLALTRRIPSGVQDVLAGNWRRESFIGSEVNGKTLGILGCGRLGRMVARYGLAFGMRVLAFDHNSESIGKAGAGVEQRDLSSLLSGSDVLSIHLPLNTDTRGFLSRERIFSIKRGALLLNTARGELLDEAALVEALETGHLSGAALDVLTGDSSWSDKAADNPLIGHARHYDNLLITPHVGGCTYESMEKTSKFIAERFAKMVRDTKS